MASEYQWHAFFYVCTTGLTYCRVHYQIQLGRIRVHKGLVSNDGCLPNFAGQKALHLIPHQTTSYLHARTSSRLGQSPAGRAGLLGRLVRLPLSAGQHGSLPGDAGGPLTAAAPASMPRSSLSVSASL